MLLFILISICFFNTLIPVKCRGPHHPRGQKIVQHHVHYRPTRSADQKLLQDEELVHDTAHIQEHLEDVIEQPDISKMTDEELDFYYFQVHDTDKNSKLDGLEILQAIMHTVHHNESEDEQKEDDDNISYFIELIDRVLLEDDVDNDGYLNYAEYTTSRRKNVNDKEPSVKIVP